MSDPAASIGVCALCGHVHDGLDSDFNEVPCDECPKGVCVDVPAF